MIRWITPFLGTGPVSSVVLEAGQQLLDVRDLVDKFGNSSATIRKKIEEGVEVVRSGQKVIVGCDYGISRSNAIAAGVLSVYEEISFDQAVRQIIQIAGEQEIKLDPLNAVREVLQKREIGIEEGSPSILVTGGTGFIGQALLSLLGESYRTFAPSRDEIDLASGAIQLDLYVKEHRITHLVHLANPRVYTSNCALGESLVMLRNVLEVCRLNDVHLFYPSSWEIYSGYRSSNLLANESLPPNPKGPYGETKWLCESLINHHRRYYGLRCGMLRSSPIYGITADRPKFIRTFIAKACKDVPISTHDYINDLPRLDLMHISDFVGAIISAIKNGFSGDVNLGSGHLLAIRDVAAMIRERLGSQSEIESQMIMDYVANIVMDISIARDVLCWVPVVPFEKGLMELLNREGGRNDST